MRALVVGLGHMGRFHRRALADLGYDVVTLDPDPRAGADFLHLPFGRDFDAIAVATPIEYLAPTAALWAHRTRRLLIEKPMATDTDEARELLAALEDLDHRVAVGYIERFNPQFRALRQRLAGRRVLAARFTRYNARPTVDVALDLQSHDIDLARVLGLDPIDGPVTLNSLAGAATIKREIMLSVENGPVPAGEWADLTDHDLSPLHAQWHALLSGADSCASAMDGFEALYAIERRATCVAAPEPAR